jgi:hypothetical protein
VKTSRLEPLVSKRQERKAAEPWADQKLGARRRHTASGPRCMIRALDRAPSWRAWESANAMNKRSCLFLLVSCSKAVSFRVEADPRARKSGTMIWHSSVRLLPLRESPSTVVDRTRKNESASAGFARGILCAVSASISVQQSAASLLLYITFFFLNRYITLRSGIVTPQLEGQLNREHVIANFGRDVSYRCLMYHKQELGVSKKCAGLTMQWPMDAPCNVLQHRTTNIRW